MYISRSFIFMMNIQNFNLYIIQNFIKFFCKFYISLYIISKSQNGNLIIILYYAILTLDINNVLNLVLRNLDNLINDSLMGFSFKI